MKTALLAALMLCAGLCHAGDEGGGWALLDGCLIPNIDHAIIKPSPAFYQANVPVGKVSISCKKGYFLYDTEEFMYIGGGTVYVMCTPTFKFVYMKEVVDPQSRFICTDPPVACPLELTKALRAEPAQDVYYSGDEVEFSCDGEYYLFGSAYGVCESDGKWSPSVPTCRPKCPKPMQDHLIVLPPRDFYNYRARITLKCDPGYTLTGSPRRKCESSGKFFPTITPGLCRRLGCDAPPQIENGQYTPTVPYGELYDEGTAITYKCDINYRLVGKTQRICSSEGVFLWSEPKCVEIKCDRPMDIENGEFEPDKDEYSVGKTVTYTCKENFKLSTKSGERTCKLNPDLVSAEFEPAPMCVPVTCNDPSKIENGYYEPVQDDYYINDDVTYMCDEGFKMVGGAVSVCELDYSGLTGTFTKPPTCVPILCDTPMDIENGDFEERKKKYGLGGTVTYECDTNYYLDGPETATCVLKTKTTGEFTEAPVCRPVTCKDPATIGNGYFEPVQDVYYIGDDVKYTCEPGYMMMGEAVSVCELDYTGIVGFFTQPPKCVPILCNTPMDIENGDFEERKKKYRIDEIVEYKCNKNYYLAGPEIATCLQTSPTTAEFTAAPVCEPIVCDQPAELVNGRFEKVKDTYRIDEKVVYECDETYYLDGPKVATCKQATPTTGKFTKAPVCIPIYCDKPGSIANGKFDPDDVERFRIGEEVTYECDENFKFGSDIRIAICMQTGVMTAEFTPAAICVPIKCDKPMDIDNGSYEPEEDEYFIGNSVTYTCMYGYRLSRDPGTSTCLLDRGGMTASFDAPPKCIQIFCSNPGPPENGAMMEDVPKHEVDQIVKFTCDPCYKLVGVQEVVCMPSGYYSKPFPKCTMRTCDWYPKVPNDGDIKPRKKQYYCGEKVEYICADGFDRVGAQFTECQPDGTFSGETPICEPPKCPLPKLNKYVFVRPRARGGVYLYQAEIKYFCRSGYTLDGATSAVCGKDGTFDKESPVCTKNTCGRPPMPTNGFVVDDEYQEEYMPGDVVYYECDDYSDRLEGSDYNECGRDGNWVYEAPICQKEQPSCKGKCFSSKPVKNAKCQCDSACCQRGDCCADYKDYCSKYSCCERCGDKGRGRCRCDQGCSGLGAFGCCKDYVNACPGEWYLEDDFRR